MAHVIAIDGPAGAGKSTIARRLAERLGYTYIDTGAMYRSVALWALRQNVSPDDAFRLEQLAVAAEIGLLAQARVHLNGEDVTEAIRTPEISAAASKVAAVAAVRAALVEKQRRLAERESVVMEGRDIGSVVFPDSPARFYLDAAPEERARRRHTEEQQKGISSQGADAVLASLLNRDRIDSSRATAPLKVADGARVLDTTGLSIEQVVQTVYDHLPRDWRTPD